jgi:hypothetical protein
MKKPRQRDIDGALSSLWLSSQFHMPKGAEINEF